MAAGGGLDFGVAHAGLGFLDEVLRFLNVALGFLYGGLGFLNEVLRGLNGGLFRLDGGLRGLMVGLGFGDEDGGLFAFRFGGGELLFEGGALVAPGEEGEGLGLAGGGFADLDKAGAAEEGAVQRGDDGLRLGCF